MKRIMWLWSGSVAGLVALTAAAAPLPAQDAEQAAVMAVINRMFEGMRKGDSAMVRSTFHPSLTVASASFRNGTPVLSGGSADEFLKAVGTPHEQVWDERIWDPIVQVDDNLATAWTPYAFHLGDRLSHCGVNAFQLFKGSDGWKIIRITDTRRRDGCTSGP
jgi:hypothetical protein